MSDIHWMIGDGNSTDISQDTWIADLPLSRWPTFVSSEVGPSLPVSALISQESKAWHVHTVSRLFGAELAQKILAIPLAYSEGPDTRLWRRSCLARAPTRDLVDRFRPRASGLADVAWIWRLPIHPRIQLFLWKLMWDRLPTCALLAARGLPISPLCPICGLQEETVEHAIFTCSRAHGLWQQLQSSPWLSEEGSTRHSFLLAIRSVVQRGLRHQGASSAYLAYHIWLSRNQIVFAEETVSPQAISPQAITHMAATRATEYLRSDSAFHSDRPGHWDSSAALPAHRSTVFISWEPPPLGYVKVNFDGSVSDRMAGSGFIVRGPDGLMLAAGGHGSIDISVPMAELQAAWAGITYAIRKLGAPRVVIEGDSLSVIRWIRRDPDLDTPINPLICDIWASLQNASATLVRHVYREANAAADWIASTVARNPGQWEWHFGDPCPIILQQIMYSDISGLTRARQV